MENYHSTVVHMKLLILIIAFIAILNFAYAKKGDDEDRNRRNRGDDEATWEQCQNDRSPRDGNIDDCYWGEAILTRQNSVYTEGDVVPQRFIRLTEDAGDHFTTFDHTFFDADQRAYTYDFYATADYTQRTKFRPCQGIQNSFRSLTASACNSLYNTRSIIPLPSESINNRYPHVRGAEDEALASNQVTRNLYIACGHFNGGRFQTLNACDMSKVHITILGRGNANKNLINSVTPPTADEFTQMKVSYKTLIPNTYVIIWVGGHLAKTSYWNDANLGAYRGLGAASGEEFQQRIIAADDDLEADGFNNKLSRRAVVSSGKITISAVLSGTQIGTHTFPYVATGLLPASFSLCAPATANCGNMREFSNLPCGEYVITQTALPDYVLSALTCTKGASQVTTALEYNGGSAHIYLAPGDQVSCTYNNVLDTNFPPTEILPLELRKTSSGIANTEYHWEITKAVNNNEEITYVANGNMANVNYSLRVSHDTGTTCCWIVSGEFSIRNPNEEIVAIESISQTFGATADCTMNPLAPMEILPLQTLSFQYSCSLGSEPLAADLDTLIVTYGTAGRTVSSSIPVTWMYQPLNELVTVTDLPAIPATSVSIDDLNPYFINYEVQYPADVQLYNLCTDKVNTATLTTLDTSESLSASASINICYAGDLSVSLSAIPSFIRITDWTIAKKSLSGGEVYTSTGSAAVRYQIDVTKLQQEAGYKTTGIVTVTNPNTWQGPAFTLTIESSGGNCGSTQSGQFQLVGGIYQTELNFNYECTYDTNPLNAIVIAKVLWDPLLSHTALGEISNSASAQFLTPTETTGPTIITVTDALCPGGSCGTFSTTGTYLYSSTFTQTAGTCSTYDNTAIISEIAGQIATASVRVCSGIDLQVANTAVVPTFTRSYLWSISKASDKSEVHGTTGTATVNYMVTVNAIGSTDSDFAVSSTITVTNPSAWKDFNVADLTVTSPHSVCHVAPFTATILAAGQSISTSLECVWPAGFRPTSPFSDSVILTWRNALTYYTPSNSAEGSAQVIFNIPTTSKAATVSVADTFATAILGTVTATETTNTFTYTKAFTFPTADCNVYDNVATIVETNQNATAEVKICGPSPYGAENLDYWLSDEGQGIISRGATQLDANGNSVCSVGVFLRNYSPFNDMTVYSNTCPTVASYVAGVLKACTSSTPAMLKAQMLVTALNVYFYREIGAPLPIGTRGVDLTAICSTISAAGTCTGPLVDARTAFFGNTALTVQAILDALNRHYVNGIWYNNDKNLQELAIDVSSAINYNKAFLAKIDPLSGFSAILRTGVSGINDNSASSSTSSNKPGAIAIIPWVLFGVFLLATIVLGALLVRAKMNEPADTNGYVRNKL